MNIRKCEACRLFSGEVSIDSDEPRQPYWVCVSCANRLQNRSLRPLEWFNLAAIHSPSKFLLHDDFYDQHGVATYSQAPVVGAEQLPAPTLSQVAGDLDRLLDYALTRYVVGNDVIAALKLHDTGSVLHILQSRSSAIHNIVIESTIYSICARVIGRQAEDWIRQRWQSDDPAPLFALAEATAECLPPDEGFQLVVNALAHIPQKELAQECAALAWFRSSATLNWIEQHAASPVMQGWGRLAALSQFQWQCAVKWLHQGRPLSLIALDALKACWRYDTGLLKQFAPKLLEPQPIPIMTAVLREYARKDSVPRVEQSVDQIVQHWADIC
jgi:hypothetical protein